MEQASIFVWEIGLVAVIVFVSFTVGVLAYLKSRKKESSKYFLGFSISVALLIASAFVSEFFAYTFPNISVFLSKLTFASVTAMSCFLFLFSLTFPLILSQSKIIRLIIAFFGVIISFFILFSSFFVQGIKLQPWGFDVITSAYNNFIFLPFIILLMVLSVVNFIRSYFRSNRTQRKQISYLFIGIIIFLLASVFFNIILPNLTGNQQFYRMGNYSFAIFVILTAYAITKHRLFNIKVIITELAVIIISSFLFIEIFISESISTGILKGIIWLIASYGGYLLIKSVISEIERRKEVEELAEKLTVVNNNLLTLQHINNKMVSTLELHRVAQEIVESLSTELSWKGGFVSLVDEKKETINIAAISEKVLTKISPFLTKKIAEYHLHLNKTGSVLLACIKKIEIEYSDDFYKVIKGALKKEVAQKIQKVLKIKTFACAPVVYRGKVIGAIVIGFDKKLAHITQEERKMISSIADQAAIAIENAKLYEEIEAANVKLKELDKLKNEFLSIASHQVRTPLSIIKGYILLLRTKKAGELSAQQERFMKNIQEANEQLINIINDFLNLSRIEQKRMKLEISKSDIKKIINEVMERLNHEAELKKIKLDFSSPKDNLPKINIDEPKIMEVITNLIDNAIKYSPENSKVEVRVKKKDNFLDISVKDSGIGIPEDFKDKLFQKFSRAHNAIQAQPSGNGIGLFVVKKIIDAHRGQIIVKTKEGKGTIFTVKLNYKSGLKPGEEVDANKLEKEGIIRYDEYKR